MRPVSLSDPGFRSVTPVASASRLIWPSACFVLRSVERGADGRWNTPADTIIFFSSPSHHQRPSVRTPESRAKPKACQPY